MKQSIQLSLRAIFQTGLGTVPYFYKYFKNCLSIQIHLWRIAQCAYYATACLVSFYHHCLP